MSANTEAVTMERLVKILRCAAVSESSEVWLHREDYEALMASEPTRATILVVSLPYLSSATKLFWGTDSPAKGFVRIINGRGGMLRIEDHPFDSEAKEDKAMSANTDPRPENMAGTSLGYIWYEQVDAVKRHQWETFAALVNEKLGKIQWYTPEARMDAGGTERMPPPQSDPPAYMKTEADMRLGVAEAELVKAVRSWFSAQREWPRCACGSLKRIERIHTQLDPALAVARLACTDRRCPPMLDLRAVPVPKKATDPFQPGAIIEVKP